MSNSYNISALLKKSLCKIVFTEDYDTAADLEKFVYQQEPRYFNKSTVLPQRRVGPFLVNNRKSVFKFLCKSKGFKEVAREKGSQEAKRYLHTELDKMELDGHADFAPKSLSRNQRLRADCLYHVLDGKFYFLLFDCARERIEDQERRINSKSGHFMIAEYMRCSEQYEFAPYELIWITDLSVEEMLELLGESAKENDYSFFAMDEQKNVSELNKEKLLSEFVQKRRQIDCAYQEAQNCDGFFRTALPQYLKTDDLKKAFELYQSAAEQGHPGAQLRLAAHYAYGHEACTQDGEKALYWYIMAEYGKEHLRNVPENVWNEVHQTAPRGIKNLVLRVPSGKEMLRKYAGEEAEKLIAEAEKLAEKAEDDAKIQKLLDGMKWTREDQERFNKMADEALGKMRKR